MPREEAKRTDWEHLVTQGESIKQDKIKKKVAVYSDPRSVMASTLDMHRAIKEGDPKEVHDLLVSPGEAKYFSRVANLDLTEVWECVCSSVQFGAHNCRRDVNCLKTYLRLTKEKQYFCSVDAEGGHFLSPKVLLVNGAAVVEHLSAVLTSQGSWRTYLDAVLYDLRDYRSISMSSKVEVFKIEIGLTLNEEVKKVRLEVGKKLSRRYKKLPIRLLPIFFSTVELESLSDLKCFNSEGQKTELLGLSPEEVKIPTSVFFGCHDWMVEVRLPILAKAGGKYTMDTSLEAQREIVFWLNNLGFIPLGESPMMMLSRLERILNSNFKCQEVTIKSFCELETLVKVAGVGIPESLKPNLLNLWMTGGLIRDEMVTRLRTPGGGLDKVGVLNAAGHLWCLENTVLTLVLCTLIHFFLSPSLACRAMGIKPKECLIWFGAFIEGAMTGVLSSPVEDVVQSPARSLLLRMECWRETNGSCSKADLGVLRPSWHTVVNGGCASDLQAGFHLLQVWLPMFAGKRIARTDQVWCEDMELSKTRLCFQYKQPKFPHQVDNYGPGPQREKGIGPVLDLSPDVPHLGAIRKAARGIGGDRDLLAKLCESAQYFPENAGVLLDRMNLPKGNPRRLAVSVGIYRSMALIAMAQLGKCEGWEEAWWLAEAKQENKKRQLKQVSRNLERKIQKVNASLAEMD